MVLLTWFKIVSFLIIIKRRVKKIIFCLCLAELWWLQAQRLVQNSWCKKNVKFESTNFPETLVVLNFNEGRIFITLSTAPMALLMLHHLKTVFIGKLASRTLVGKVYGEVNPCAGSFCMNTGAFFSIVSHFSKLYWNSAGLAVAVQ